MFMPEARTPIWLCTTPTDMRKSFTGLSAQVKRLLGENPTSGELFVFIFFGLVATVGTRYVFGPSIPSEVWVGGIVMGLLAAGILEANNIRDIDTDRAAGK